MPVEIEYDIISDAQSIAANRWTQTEQVVPKAEKRLTYDPYIDIQKARNLYAERATCAPEIFAEKLDTLKLELWTNIGRALDERNNRINHTITFDLVDGVLYPPDHCKPMVTMIKDGIVHRQEMKGLLEDKLREQAELFEITKVQAWANDPDTCVTNPQTGIGEVLVKASPPGSGGSSYIHNFVDLYQLTEENEGNRHIVMTRMNSGLNTQTYAQFYQSLNPDLTLPNKLTPDFFIANPQRTIMTFAELQQFVQQGAKGRFEAMCDYVKRASEPAVAKSISQLLKDPYDIETYLRFNKAVFKANDLVIEQLEDRQSTKDEDVREMLATIDDQDMIWLSQQELAQVYTACGIMEDLVSPYADIQGLYLAGYYHTPASVLDLAKLRQDEGYGVDDYGTRKITCKECACSYARPENVKIPACFLTIDKNDQRVKAGKRKAGEICGNTTGISC